MNGKPLTWNEFEKQVAEENARLTVIHEKVYAISEEFLQWHPGGHVAATQIGRDGTAAFDAFHELGTQELLANYYVGDIVARGLEEEDFTREILKIQKAIRKNGWWRASKLYYCWDFLSTFGFAFISLWILKAYAQDSLPLLLVASCLMGIFLQQGGWLSHDLLHNQVFSRRKYNYICGFLTTCVGQGFSPNWWLNKHNTHHAVPNVLMEDPDIDTMPFLAWSEDALELFSDYSDDAMARLLILHQPVLLFPLFIFVRLSWYTYSFLYTLSGKLTATSAILDILGMTIHCLWQFLLPLTWLSPARAMLYFTLSQSLGGVLLAVVFVLNHSGTSEFKSDAVKAKSFYELQVLTARNIVSTPFTDWLTGGLDYQIEHHLFPTLPRHNYHLVAPYIQEACAKYKVQYHETTFWQGISEVLERLRRVSDIAAKKVCSKAL